MVTLKIERENVIQLMEGMLPEGMPSSAKREAAEVIIRAVESTDTISRLVGVLTGLDRFHRDGDIIA